MAFCTVVPCYEYPEIYAIIENVKPLRVYHECELQNDQLIYLVFIQVLPH